MTSSSDPTPDASPSPEMVEAWLAGKMTPEQSEAVERQLAEREDAPLPDDDFRGLDAETPSDEVDQLIGQILADGEPAPPDAEDWRSILEPSDDPAFLGTLGHSPRYEVDSVIAIGGMSIVFKGRDPALDRTVALKALTPGLAANHLTRERFLREARVAAKLDHENILPIHGVHDGASVPFFAMKFIEGGTLQDALDGSPISFDRQRSIARQIASALETAHTAGVIHRDIKPANILLDADGQRAWLCDFGIARSTEDPSLTYAGSVAGTPHYMSPEQAAGGELDGRSDLFSLGAVLYHCATGNHAFSGNTTAAVLQQVQSTSATSAIPKKANLPKWFGRLLANLLAKDPRDRPKDATAVVRAIDDEHSPRPKHTARRNRRLAIAAVTAVSLAALSFGLLQIPAVKTSVNKALAKRHEQAFFLSGKLGTYDDLVSAIEAAADGDTILLPGGAPIPIDKALLPDGKTLTLKPADPEQRPTLTTAIEGAPGLIAVAPLHLVGIDFVLNPKRDSDGIIIVRSTDATITGCTFTARQEIAAGDNEAKARTIDLHAAASIRISECEFDLEQANAISLFGTARADIRDTQIKAFYGIDIHTASAEQAGIEIDISGSGFIGDVFLKRSSTGAMPAVTCTVADCDFKVDRELCWLPTGSERTLRERLRWNARNNQHIPGKAFVNLSQPSEFVAANHFPITNYSTPAAIVSRLFDKGDGLIKIEQTGERFDRLADAIEAAPDGATLLLSGRIAPTKEILAPRRRLLHFKAAPGARPTIVGTIPRNHALFLRGAGSIKGIRFLRESAVQNSRPVLGVVSGDHPFLVEDCVFESIPAEGGAGNPFTITSTSEITVRRCIFINPDGSNLGLYSSRDGLSPMTVKLEDCLFTGGQSIHLYSKLPNTKLDLSAERCVFLTDNLVGLWPRSHLDTTALSFTDCIIDCRETMFSFTDTAAETLKRHLSWSGQSNVYREGTRVLEPPVSTFGAPQPELLHSFADLAPAIANFRETKPIHGAPFDRTKLGKTASPIALLKAIDPNIESPATETLKGFVRANLPADEFRVTTAVDEDDGSADPSLGAGISLREAVAHSPLGTTIKFDPFLDRLTLSLGAIAIGHDTIIDASGLAARPIIDAGNQSRHFYASQHDLHLRGLTLTGGMSPEAGGSIYTDYDRLTVEDCHFIGNRADRGGAVALLDSTSTFIDCHFETNHSDKNGGAVRIVRGLAALDGCRFVENTSYVGAAVRSREEATVTITNCDFEKNRANGAVAVAAYDGTMSIAGSRFTGNVATDTTGAVYASRAATLSVTDSTFADNIATTTAGAIFHNGTALKLHNNQFQNNTATSAGGVHIIRGELDVRGNTFVGNTEPQMLIESDLDTSRVLENPTTEVEKPEFIEGAFHIDGQPGAHATLSAAVSAATDGDTIFLHPDDLILVDALEIPINKSLTLRPVPDAESRPRLTTAQGALGITSHSPLALHGLDFELRPQRNSGGIVRLVSTSATITDCTFTGTRTPPAGIADAQSRVIDLIDGSSAEIEGCRISVEHANAITFRSKNGFPAPASVTIGNTQIASYHAIAVDKHLSDEHPIEIAFKASRFTGQHFLKGATDIVPPITCRAEGSEFTTARALAWFDSKNPTTVRERLAWSGQNNTHPLGKATLLVGGDQFHAGPHREFDIATDTVRTGTIQIADSDERFTSLAEACTAAPEGSTLLLSGDIVCEHPIATPLKRTLHFRAAPGASPNVIFSHPTRIGLRLRGPATVEGIAFARRHATAEYNALAMVATAGAGPYRFERCRFESSPDVASRSSGVGLALYNTGAATLRDCTFHMPTAAAFLIDYTKDLPGRTTHLQLERCLVAAGLGVFHRTTAGPVSTRITADRCVFVGNLLLAESPRPAPDPVRWQVTESLLDLALAYFEISPDHAPALPETLTWEGRDNHHSPGAPIVRFYPKGPQGGETTGPLKDLDLKKFLADFPHATGTGAIVAPLFDDLAYPIAKPALLRALPKALDTPTRTILESP